MRYIITTLACGCGDSSPAVSGDAPTLDRPAPLDSAAAPDSAVVASTPESLPPSPVKQLVLGGGRGVALLENGDVYWWGQWLDAPEQSQPRPTKVPEFERVAALGSGVSDSLLCLLHDGGTVSCQDRSPAMYGDGWGDRGAQMSGVKPATASLQGVRLIAPAGRDRGCALLEDGTVKCWSYFGDDAINGAAGPGLYTIEGLSEVTQVSASPMHACALRGDGTVWCWGSNNYGELGDPSWSGSDQRIEKSDGELRLVGGVDRPKAAPVGGLKNARAIGVDGAKSCALLADGAIVCWGSIAAGPEIQFKKPVPTRIDGLAPVAEMSVGEAVCGLHDNGTVSCFGHDLMKTSFSLKGTVAPYVVAGLDDAVKVIAGEYAACAIRKSGAIACWGSNRYGSLGDGTGKPSKLTHVQW